MTGEVIYLGQLLFSDQKKGKILFSSPVYRKLLPATSLLPDKL